MPQITYYVAMPFRLTEQGAIAFSRTGDPALGDFEHAVIITKIGEIDELAL